MARLPSLAGLLLAIMCVASLTADVGATDPAYDEIIQKLDRLIIGQSAAEVLAASRDIRLDDITKRLDEHAASRDVRLDDITKRLDEHVASRDIRLDDITKRLDEHVASRDIRLDDITKRLDEHVASRDVRLNDITKRLDELTASQINITAALDALQKQLVPGLPCPADWKHIGTACYFISSQWATQPDAQLACGRLASGAHLASIHAEYQHAIKALLASSGCSDVWLGLERVDDEWAWSDGSSLDVTDWEQGFPDNSGGENDCVFWSPGSGQWFDNRCTDTNQYLCQLDLAV